MMNKDSNAYQLVKGIIKENPTLVTLLGMCPTLAVTTMAFNGIGMGLATTFVLVCFIVLIASFVTLIEFLMKGFLPELYNALGIFLSLITVNCIILGRAEAFASKNKLFPSILDGLGMGLGFTLALFTMGSVREILGTGTWLSGTAFAVTVPLEPLTIFIMPAGGFFVLGVIIAVVNKLANKKPPAEVGCHNCPNAKTCKNFGDCPSAKPSEDKKALEAVGEGGSK